MNAKFGSEQINRADLRNDGKKNEDVNMLSDPAFGAGLGGGVFEEEDSGSHDSD